MTEKIIATAYHHVVERDGENRILHHFHEQLCIDDWTWFIKRRDEVDERNDHEWSCRKISVDEAVVWYETHHKEKPRPSELIFHMHFPKPFNLTIIGQKQLLRFDPRGWVLVGIGEREWDFETMDGYPCWQSVEYLFTREEKYLVLYVKRHVEAPCDCDPEAEFLEDEIAADWCFQHCIDVPQELSHFVSHRMLTVENAPDWSSKQAKCSNPTPISNDSSNPEAQKNDSSLAISNQQHVGDPATREPDRHDELNSVTERAYEAASAFVKYFPSFLESEEYLDHPLTRIAKHLVELGFPDASFDFATDTKNWRVIARMVGADPDSLPSNIYENALAYHSLRQMPEQREKSYVKPPSDGSPKSDHNALDDGLYPDAKLMVWNGKHYTGLTGKMITILSLLWDAHKANLPGLSVKAIEQKLGTAFDGGFMKAFRVKRNRKLVKIDVAEIVCENPINSSVYGLRTPDSKPQ